MTKSLVGKQVKAVHEDRTDYKSKGSPHKGGVQSKNKVIKGEVIRHADGTVEIFNEEGYHTISENLWTITPIAAPTEATPVE